MKVSGTPISVCKSRSGSKPVTASSAAACSKGWACHHASCP
jgi:hypothetical protein